MNRDEFGGIAIDDAPNDEFGGVLVASPDRDEFGGIAIDRLPATPVAQSIPVQPAVESVVPVAVPTPVPTVGTLRSIIGSAARGLSQNASGTLRAIGEGAAALGRLTGIGEGDPEKLTTFRAGQALQKGTEALFPVNPETAQGFWTGDVPQGIGQVAGLLTGAGAIRGITQKALSTLGPKVAKEIATKAAVRGALAVGAGSEFDDAYQRSVERGDSPDLAATKAAGYAVLSTAIESKLGVGRLLKRFGIDEPTTLKAVTKAATGSIAKTGIKELIAGFSEEALQRVAQDYIVDGKLDFNAIAREGGAGGVVQALLGMAGHAAHRSGARRNLEWIQNKQRDGITPEEAAASGLDASTLAELRISTRTPPPAGNLDGGVVTQPVPPAAPAAPVVVKTEPPIEEAVAAIQVAPPAPVDTVVAPSELQVAPRADDAHNVVEVGLTPTPAPTLPRDLNAKQVRQEVIAAELPKAQEAVGKLPVTPVSKPPELMTPEEYKATEPKPDGIREEFSAKNGPLSVRVVKNPTPEDYQAFNKEHEEQFPNDVSGDPKTRFTIDSKGNRYVWASADAAHSSMEAWLKNNRGVTANQNTQFLSQKYHIRRALFSKKPVLASALDGLGVELPEGYVLEGENYVFKPVAVPPVAATEVKAVAPKGAKAVAQRIVNAEEAFLSFAMENASLTRDQALTALARYKKDKAIKIDPVGGQFSFTNGEFANPEVLRRAATPESQKVSGVKKPRMAEDRPPDLIDEVESNLGGKISLEQSRKLIEDFTPIGAARKLFTTKGGYAPDVAAQSVSHLREFSDVEFLEALNAAANGRKNARVTKTVEKRQISAEEAQRVDFESEILNPDGEPISVNDLYIGTQFKLDGESVTVKDLTFDDETAELAYVTLEDGRRFGVQTIGSDQIIYPDKGTIVQPNAEPVPEGMDDPFAEPKPAAPLPKLRAGENQGDVFANQTEDFALVGEKGKDAEKAAQAKAKAERDAAEAKAIQDKQQQDLFAPNPTVRESKGEVVGEYLGTQNAVSSQNAIEEAEQTLKTLQPEFGYIPKSADKNSRFARGSDLDSETIEQIQRQYSAYAKKSGIEPTDLEYHLASGNAVVWSPTGTEDFIVGQFIGDIFTVSHFAPQGGKTAIAGLLDLLHAKQAVAFAVPDRISSQLQRIGFKESRLLFPMTFRGETLMKRLVVNNAFTSDDLDTLAKWYQSERLIQGLSGTSEPQIGFQAQFAKGSTVQRPISEQAATQAVNERLGTTELPGNITFVNDPSPQSDKGSVTYVKGQLPQITINLAKHDSTESIKDTLVHELLHPTQDDPALARAVGSVAALVQEADLSRKEAIRYSADETAIEATNELIRKFYQEHANSSIFQRAITQVVIAAKRIFGVELTARQAAVILVQDAVKNHVAKASGAGLSRADEEAPTGTSKRVFNKAVSEDGNPISQEFGREIEVDGVSDLDDAAHELGGQYTAKVFSDIGLKTFEFETAKHTRMLTPEAMTTPNEEAGQELMARHQYLMDHSSELYPDSGERAGVLGNWVNSLRNIVGQMMENQSLGKPVAFSETLLKDLKSVAQGEARFWGQLLNSLRGVSDSILWAARNANITLRTMRGEAFGGPAVERFMTFIREHFKAHWTPARATELVKTTNLAQKLQRFVTIDADKLAQVVHATLQTDVKNVKEFGRVFSELFAKEFNVPVQEPVGSVFHDAVKSAVKTVLVRSIDPAYESLGKSGKKGIGKRTPLWRRLNRILNDGDMDFDQAVAHMAENQGWIIPSWEELEKLKSLVQREQDLRTISKEDLARIAALPEAEREAATAKAQKEVESGTDTERADIIKRINTKWSQWTKPISWKAYRNPVDNFEIIQNNAQAINEWITANILLKLGFVVRQTIDVGMQTLTHDPTRALGTAMLTHKNEIARGVFSSAFWKDAGAALATTYGLRAKTTRHALAAGIQGLRGKGLMKHSESISNRLDIFDRMMRTAETLAAEGKTQKAFALRLVTYVRSALLFSRAMDLLSTTGAKYAEIANRIRVVMKANGKTNAEISQQLDLIFGNMKAQWIEAYARAIQIFNEKGMDLDKVALNEAAGNILLARATAALKIIDNDSQNFEATVEDMANTIGWNEREVAGIGGIVGGIIRGVQRGGEKVGVPLAFVSAFGNAIAIGINRKLTWMGLGKLAQINGENPWYRTELDREQRLAEGFIGAGLSAFLAGLAMAGAIVVRGFWPKDDKEREKWRMEGRTKGTVEVLIPGGEGKFFALSLSVGPLALVAPALVTAGELRNVIDGQAKKQATADEEAAKRGVTAEKVELSGVDLLGVAANAFYASLLNSRTLGGAIGTFNPQGAFNLKQMAATLVSDVIPPLPGYQDIMRVAGVYMNPRLATFGDMLVPTPGSGARRLNTLGDPSGSFNQIQQIVQTLTGGNFPFPIDPNIAKKQPAYAALYAADLVPSPWQPNKGVVINGVWRPLKRSELQEFVPMQGKLFANELTQVAGEIHSLPKEEGRKLVREAYKRATDAALERIGVDVEASKAPSTSSAPSRASREPSLASSMRDYSTSAPAIREPAERATREPSPRTSGGLSGTGDRETSFVSTRSSGGGRLRGASRRRGGGRRLRTAKTRRTRTRKIRLSKPRTTPFKAGRLRTKKRRLTYT